MTRLASALALLLLGLAAPLGAQRVAPVPARSAPGLAEQRSRSLPMDSCLQDLGLLATELSPTERRAAADRLGLALDAGGLVHVELVAPEGGDAIPDAAVAARGGWTDSRWRNRLDAWVPARALIPLASDLPAGHRMVRANGYEADEVVGEGPAAIGTESYLEAGVDGAGVTIAVIDLGFQGLTAARANGDAPSLTMSTLVNLTPFAFEADGFHGTGCVEAAFDHGPGATWRLYKIDSLADLGAAVSDALANGADVFSHSISWFNTGWVDDSGGACAAANAASSGGALFFTSAGNYADRHWQGGFTAGSGSSTLHDWVLGDETLGILLQPGEGLGLHLSWDTGAGSSDYDLFLYDDSNNLLASSTAGGSTFESVSYTNSSMNWETVHARVLLFSGPALELELFATGGAPEHFTTAGSTTSPSNATGASVFAVGAVDWSLFGSPPGSSGILATYSSRGPSNGGRTLPHLVGPTNTAGFTYPAVFGGFGGTSCATPNAAGAAAVLRGTVSAFDGSALSWLEKEQARLYRDWGAAGSDDLYGAGGASLVPHASGTVWLARGWGNTLNLTSGPYYTLDAAYAAVPTAGRIVSLPGSYTEHPTGPLTKSHRIESIEGSSVMGF